MTAARTMTAYEHLVEAAWILDHARTERHGEAQIHATLAVALMLASQTHRTDLSVASLARSERVS